MRGWLMVAACVAAACWGVTPALADAPRVAVIIDDLGYHRDYGQRVLDLPGPVACSFLADAPYAPDHARAAHERGKEVLLHVPMQPHSSAAAHPHALGLQHTAADVSATLARDLQRVPYVVGINNHQGSLLTEQPRHMRWLMDAMDAHPTLYFVDSMTTPRSVALATAQAAHIRSTRRNVFLDHERSVDAIEAQVDRLIALARRNGTALAIGHPYPETLDVLERRLPTFDAKGIRLVPVSELIDVRLAQRDDQDWRVSLRLFESPTTTRADRRRPAAN